MKRENENEVQMRVRVAISGNERLFQLVIVCASERE